MGDKKRKRDEAGAGTAEQKPKRVKNKAKYEAKSNKARKKAAVAGEELGQGANAIPVKAREQLQPQQQPAAETAADDGNEEPKDLFMIDTTPMNQAEVEEKIKSKKEKKEKKRLKNEERQKRSKEEDKKEKKKETKGPSSNSSSDSSDSESETEKAPTTKDTNASAPPEATEDQPPAEAGKHARFIVFVGNLPYTATVESVKAHFSKIKPISVRIATDKNKTSECRGFGFVEFEQFDRMQTCLKLYHHSTFDDGKSPARKINVELTAGGGGKSSARKNKIKEKNEKLAAERARIAKQNKANKEKQHQKQKKQQKQQQQQQHNGETSKAAGSENAQYAGVHPSRLNRMV